MNFKKINISSLVVFTFIVVLTVLVLLNINNFFDFNLFLDSNVFFSADSTVAETINTEIVARRVGSGLATAGLGGVGTGIGLVFSGLIKGFSRNPSLKDDLFSYAIFGFALTEAIGLFALMMAFMLLYA